MEMASCTRFDWWDGEKIIDKVSQCVIYSPHMQIILIPNKYSDTEGPKFVITWFYNLHPVEYGILIADDGLWNSFYCQLCDLTWDPRRVTSLLTTSPHICISYSKSLKNNNDVTFFKVFNNLAQNDVVQLT